jgi:hypothetical protein
LFSCLLIKYLRELINYTLAVFVSNTCVRWEQDSITFAVQQYVALPSQVQHSLYAACARLLDYL